MSDRIPQPPASMSFGDDSPLLTSNDALRETLEERGYICLRGFLSQQTLLALRRDLLNICRRHGWLDDTTEPLQGIANPAQACAEPEPAWMEVYREVQLLESFHALAHDDSIMRLMEGLADEPVFVQPSKICRLKFPDDTRASTAPHQDYLFIQGSRHTWTCWLPLGDVPRSMGGISVMHGSNCESLLPCRLTPGTTNKREAIVDNLDYPWVEGDFELGDVVVLSCMTVHRGLPNCSGNRLRISVDYRYQPVSEPIVEDWIDVHRKLHRWENVYQNWQSDEWKYYWKQLDLKLIPLDAKLLEPVSC
ncbi:MAG: phytanoyl-CoA dioxygenase family protein [Pirellulales bacterium]|nr:phytanoyl-CoA dioxygenase family protein [Pirellulales bacterium]